MMEMFCSTFSDEENPSDATQVNCRVTAHRGFKLVVVHGLVFRR